MLTTALDGRERETGELKSRRSVSRSVTKPGALFGIWICCSEISAWQGESVALVSCWLLTVSPNERHLCRVDEGFDARWRAWILMRHGHKQRWYEWERIHSVLKGKKPCSWDDLLSSSLVLASPQKTVQPWHVCLWKLCQRSITFLVVLSWSPLKISKDS